MYGFGVCLRCWVGLLLGLAAREGDISLIPETKEDFKMKKFSTGIALIISSSTLIYADKASAHLKITFYEPTKPGVIELKWTGFGGGQMKTVKVDIPEGTTAEGKTQLIADALFKTPPQPQVDSTISGDMMNMLTIPSAKNIKIIRDSTGQKGPGKRRGAKIETTDGQKPAKGKADGSLNPDQLKLSGVDSSGNPSTFSTSIGFLTPLDDISINSFLSFSEIGGSSIDDWLSSIFNDLKTQLPISYQPNLSLDLTTDEITFQFPENAITGFIENGTTDIDGEPSVEMEVAVPEPTSILSLLALGTLGAASTLKRKLKPFKSIENETTKIG